MMGDAFAVPLVPAGRRTFNLMYMIMHEDVTVDPGMAIGEVTMFPGRLFRLEGGDAENFSRVLGLNIPDEWKQRASPVVRSRTDVVGDEPVAGGGVQS